MRPTEARIQMWMRDGSELRRRLHMYRVRDARQWRSMEPLGFLDAARFWRTYGKYDHARATLQNWRAAGPYPLP